MDGNNTEIRILPQEELDKIQLKSRINDLFDCMGCPGIFKENEVAVVEAMISGVQDLFLLCQPCCSQYGVNKKYPKIFPDS